MLRIRLLLVVFLTLIVVMVVLALPPIPESRLYHDFADQRDFFGVPNFLNVASNIPLLLIGGLGLLFLWRQPASAVFVERLERWPYVILFLGVVLVCFGSGYYHLAPDNARLVWDRLPMTLIFMSFLTAVMVERISLKIGLWLFLPLVGVGLGSVVYWYLGELRGAGDLRPYAMVQYYSALAILVIAPLFPSRYTRGKDHLGVLAFYVAAKALEILDAEIFTFVRIVSGHTLKHLVAAVAAYWILRMLRRRHPAAAKLRLTSKPPAQRKGFL